jgi:hypothetical protein
VAWRVPCVPRVPAGRTQALLRQRVSTVLPAPTTMTITRTLNVVIVSLASRILTKTQPLPAPSAAQGPQQTQGRRPAAFVVLENMLPLLLQVALTVVGLAVLDPKQTTTSIRVRPARNALQAKFRSMERSRQAWAVIRAASADTRQLVKSRVSTVQLGKLMRMTMLQHPAPPALMGLPQTQSLRHPLVAVPPAEQVGMRQQHCVEMTQTACVLAVSLVSTMMTAPQTLRVLAAMLVVFQRKLERQRVLHAQQGRTVLLVRQLALTVPLANM